MREWGGIVFSDFYWIHPYSKAPLNAFLWRGRPSNREAIALDGEGVLNEATLLGARQTFQKPVDKEQLLSAVRYDVAHERARSRYHRLV